MIPAGPDLVADARELDFRPERVLFDLGGGQQFTLSSAAEGCLVTGAIGSGKTSGPGSLLARAYLKAGMGGLVLCAKPEECDQWREWARAAGRNERDLVIVDETARARYNFLDAEASRPGKAGFSVNIVALLDEIAAALNEAAGEGEGGGDSAFFRQQLRHLLTNLVDLPLLAGLPVSLPLLRLIASTAPLSLAQMDDPRWQAESACWRILAEADAATQDDPDKRPDFNECRTYWKSDFPSFSDRSRSIDAGHGKDDVPSENP